VHENDFHSTVACVCPPGSVIQSNNRAITDMIFMRVGVNIMYSKFCLLRYQHSSCTDLGMWNSINLDTSVLDVDIFKHTDFLVFFLFIYVFIANLQSTP
jgi:hypothetical protein